MEENENMIIPDAEKQAIEEMEKENVAEDFASEEAGDELHGENLNDRVKVLSPGMIVAKRFFRSKLSMVGLVTLIILFLFSFVGPLFSPWGETTIDDAPAKDLVVTQPIRYVGEDGQEYTGYDVTISRPVHNIKADLTWQHWLGTDELGRDIFTRLMYGGRISLTLGFIVVIIETLIGVFLGGLAGYFGGWVDQIVMRVVDILYCIPSLPIMLILAAVLDSLQIEGIIRLYYLMVLLTLLGWAGTARMVRGQILSLREQEFMLAAKCSGLSVRRKIFKHLIPNVLPQLIVSMTLGLGGIILTEATLGYLGLGAPLGTATWGAMINYATKDEFMSDYLNFWVPPGICITLAILAFNFVGDGLRDAFDPKMKR
ncbi:MAG: ABC transporter permease [Clostridia bacterium]|nr:ABC transporter permease [Clostridia bacterium]